MGLAVGYLELYVLADHHLLIASINVGGSFYPPAQVDISPPAGELCTGILPVRTPSEPPHGNECRILGQQYSRYVVFFQTF